MPMPGYDVQILDEDGADLPAGPDGRDLHPAAAASGLPRHALACRRALRQAYLSRYPGWYLTGDAGYMDDDGYLYIMGRIDDVINVAGHRLSTGGMEEVLASHKDVAECAVIGVADQLKGELPLGLVVLKAGVDRMPPTICHELVANGARRDRAGGGLQAWPWSAACPRPAPGKILRGTMKKIADGSELKVPATIDDPAILEEIAESLQALGYAKSVA